MHREYSYRNKLKTAYKTIGDWRRMESMEGGLERREIEELIFPNYRK